MNRSLLLLLALGAAPAAHAAECGSLDAVRWLLGDWITAGDERFTHETWKEASADTFEGVATTRSRESGEMVYQETMRLVAMSGQVFFVAKVPENEFPVPLSLTSCEGRTAVFENRLHDFPKRIDYRLEDDNGLSVRVSDGGDKGFTLRFKRMTTDRARGP